jgi:hypothetical protein
MSKSTGNMNKTMTELTQDRRVNEKKDIEQKVKARQLRVLNEVGIPTYKDYVKPSDYTENPRYNATW